MSKTAHPAHKEGRFDPERFLKSVTLRQIRYFVAAAEFGKVNLAASMIAISPSAITDAVSELEASSGVRLFDRMPRGLTLTQEGRRFLAHCRRILVAVKDASDVFVSPEPGAEGTFTLAASSTVIGYFIAPLVARFRKMFPKIETHLVEANATRIVDGLADGTFDLALAVLSNIPQKPDLTCQTLMRSARRLWLPPRHPLLRRSAVALAEIATLPYIQLTIDGADQSTSDYWSANGLAPNVVFRTEIGRGGPQPDRLRTWRNDLVRHDVPTLVPGGRQGGGARRRRTHPDHGYGAALARRSAPQRAGRTISGVLRCGVPPATPG